MNPYSVIIFENNTISKSYLYKGKKHAIDQLTTLIHDYYNDNTIDSVSVSFDNFEYLLYINIYHFDKIFNISFLLTGCPLKENNDIFQEVIYKPDEHESDNYVKV